MKAPSPRDASRADRQYTPFRRPQWSGWSAANDPDVPIDPHLWFDSAQPTSADDSAPDSEDMLDEAKIGVLDQIMKDDSDDCIFHALETLFEYVYPKRDSRARTDMLRERFVTPQALLSADSKALNALNISKNDAALIVRLQSICRMLRRSGFDAAPRLDALKAAVPYLKAVFYALTVERLYILCLDARGCLKEQILMHQGTSDRAAFNLKYLLAQVERVEPAAVILSHNHPMQTLRPSGEDIECTLDALHALKATGAMLLDHVIVAGSRAVSLRGSGFIPESVWLSQRPDSRLLNGWLEA